MTNFGVRISVYCWWGEAPHSTPIQRCLHFSLLFVPPVCFLVMLALMLFFFFFKIELVIDGGVRDGSHNKIRLIFGAFKC